MSEISKKKKIGKKVVISCCLLLIFSGLVFALYPSEYRKDIAALEKTCADLTKDDLDGRVYEPIVGRYLGSKSQTMMVPSISSTWVSYKMVFQTKNGNVIVYAGADINFKEYFSKVEKILGTEATHKKKIQLRSLEYVGIRGKVKSMLVLKEL